MKRFVHAGFANLEFNKFGSVCVCSVFVKSSVSCLLVGLNFYGISFSEKISFHTNRSLFNEANNIWYLGKNNLDILYVHCVVSDAV